MQFATTRVGRYDYRSSKDGMRPQIIIHLLDIPGKDRYDIYDLVKNNLCYRNVDMFLAHGIYQEIIQNYRGTITAAFRGNTVVEIQGFGEILDGAEERAKMYCTAGIPGIICDYRYEKSETEYVTGVKNCAVPKGAIAGGNGSFQVASPVEMQVFFAAGSPIDRINIYPEVKEILQFLKPGGRVSKSLFERLMAVIAQNQQNQVLICGNYNGWPTIVGLEAMLSQII